ncbi:uncharacterized protein K02A2.6-like [Topomyia yanbarensis]|uniref:uncharacterized protein K02A2.6-like n=1 Tax=Topomyia yanbarensis TaxID=2498891 RepID=UPI00273B0063|nr:uncharacterized protein K02A2.6-like [Topomyia yanbarensis]
MVQHIAAIDAAVVAISWDDLLDKTRDDVEIQDILSYLKDDTLNLLPVAYRIISSELCDVGGVLVRGDRIVIPTLLRRRVLDIAHDGHPGMRMMKSYLRSAVWWPKLDSDVETYVKKCRGCTLVTVPDAPEPMIGSWEDIAVDFLGPLLEDQHLFVVVDSYSRYLEVCEMTRTESKDTIDRLREIFSRYGVPSLIKADNGPQFSSEEFKNFCKEYGIQLVSTIPYWPQMNGQVE